MSAMPVTFAVSPIPPSSGQVEISGEIGGYTFNHARIALEDARELLRQLDLAIREVEELRHRRA